jgi:hypothetical protein
MVSMSFAFPNGDEGLIIRRFQSSFVVLLLSLYEQIMIRKTAWAHYTFLLVLGRWYQFALSDVFHLSNQFVILSLSSLLSPSKNANKEMMYNYSLSFLLKSFEFFVALASFLEAI